MTRVILADAVSSISEFKKSPMAAVEAGDGFPVAVLNHNQPAFYCIPAEAYEALMDRLEDVELTKLVDERMSDGSEPVKVDINEL